MQLAPTLSREEYEAAVVRAKEYIAAGDIIQVVLSHRMSAYVPADPFDVYRALRAINPSPYMFYLSFGDLKLIGASPEILVTEDRGDVVTRPIAGTRRRGATEAQDLALERELLADEKERAEHIMLVDLHRNDIGRVCEPGTVHVKPEELMVVERYSHVMHIVSTVRGRLAGDRDQFDLLRAAFPAGTLSGAPKIRAMEIIDELEPLRRGPYGGAIGYFGFGGAMDTCITLRTIVMRGKMAYIQAGGGIVADSQPETEYQETLAKAGALLEAMQLSEEGMQ
jgi:anthranilate synthase component 1